MLDCAEAIILGALERKESRGAHTRTDMPDRDDSNWLKHILIAKNEDGKPAVTYQDVTITQWEPQVRSYWIKTTNLTREPTYASNLKC